MAYALRRKYDNQKKPLESIVREKERELEKLIRYSRVDTERIKRLHSECDKLWKQIREKSRKENFG